MVIVEELVDSPDCESGFLRVRVPSFTQISSKEAIKWKYRVLSR
jgi:hypothetical protein